MYLQISTEESVNNDQYEPLLDVDKNQVLDEIENIELIPKRSKRQQNAKSFGPDFLVIQVEGTRDKISSSVPNLLNAEGDPLTYSDAMASEDNVFWNEAIDNEM